MDPNELLRQLRTGQYTTAADFHEAFADLDEWLSRGGFLPDAWAGDRMT